MRRLVLLIGVKKTGDLTELESVESCLAEMEKWALSQKIPPTNIKKFIDANDATVRIDDIYEWLEAQAGDLQIADQLLIYFSGHGMRGEEGDLWLLSDAPKKTGEAVNVASTKELAAWNGFNHVVLIGDCCGTVPPDIEWHSMKGTDIFPNPPRAARIRRRTVDYLTAAQPGNGAVEVKIGGKAYSPYTTQLSRALQGEAADVLEEELAGAETPVVVRAKKLAEWLHTAVSEFLRQHNVREIAPPDEDIHSTDEWLSEFQSPPAKSEPPPPLQTDRFAGPGHDLVNMSSLDEFAPVVPPSAIGHIVKPAESLLSARARFAKDVTTALDEPAVESRSQKGWSAFIPNGWHFETQCGFYVTGEGVAYVESTAGANCWLEGAREVKADISHAELVLITFADKTGVLLPAIPEQLGFIHLNNGAVVSVGYEPSGRDSQGRQATMRGSFEPAAQWIRSLRDVLANTAAAGELQFAKLPKKTIREVLEKTVYDGNADFSLLLMLAYVAFASRDLGLLKGLCGASQWQFKFLPLDMLILARLLDPRFVDAPYTVGPPIPLLTQGWPLLRAARQQLPQALAGITEHYSQSTWTRLDEEGVSICSAYLKGLEASKIGGSGAAEADVEHDFTELLASVSDVAVEKRRDDDEEKYFTAGA